MPHASFDPNRVGLCVSTLHPNPRQFAAADVERLTHVSARAGFPSLALQVHWVTTYGVDATRALLHDAAVVAGALEGAMTWTAGPDAAIKDAEQLLDIASTLGAGVLHAACLSPKLDSLSRAVDGFATLCERARAHRVKVSIEFIPWYGIPDLDTAWRIVQESGASNGGICIDLMHWERQPGGPNLALLRKIPGERISYVQLTDAPAATALESADAYMAECLTARPLPGDGVVDVNAVIESLAATGADPYFAFQVCNPKLAGEGADVMAARLRANASALFA